VSLFDDDHDVRADEQLLAGRDVPGHEQLAAALALMRALADEAAPPPTPTLAAVLRDGLPAVGRARPPAAAGTRSRALRVARWGAGLGLAGKILLGAGVAAAAVVGTATIPAVPDAVQVPVRAALTDLGHLISGSAGEPLPVPSTTTPEPVGRVGATTTEDHSSAEPGNRTAPQAGGEATGSTRPEPASSSAEPSASAPAGRGDGGRPSAAPDQRPSPSPRGPGSDPTPRGDGSATHPSGNGSSGNGSSDGGSSGRVGNPQG
jgi:hypothetical protein